ncbi:MAG: hypothetical protein JNL41_03785 [Phenylobacterium sp.]|uniref:hypothetical protein n=1 Tax=Phenylobacterium sp. TaxID=1871053 RepID=UPI001A3DBB47|nr:hypothetical protein [Phenylobacterium sp.]MBL8553375.1 hypothetical protein [Phenylobacterium sp.]
MKPGLLWIVALALAAGPAVAQGTFSPGQKPGSTFGGSAPSTARKPGSYLPPAASAPAAKPRAAYGAPEAPKAGGFEPYKPFSGSSVYLSPNGARRSDPCETSVYVDACGRKK